MSQALQSLNSILKYKQERERQKIDRSLSMMDMATRLRQQQIDNARQERMMQLREADAKRDAKESAARLTNLNLQQEKLKRDASDVSIEQENELRDLQVEKLRLAVELESQQLTDKISNNIRASLDNVVTTSFEKNYEKSLSFIPGFESMVRASALPSQDFEEQDINTVAKSSKKYAKNDAEKDLLNYIVKNHRELIPATAAVNLVGFKTSQDSVVDALSSMYQDVQTNTKFQKLFENVGVSIEDLSSSMVNLSNIITQKNTYDTFIQSGELEKQALRQAKNQELDENSLLKKLSLDILQVDGLTNEEIDALNEQLIRDGKDPIPNEEFR